jgi:pimeloyl-ACP methyl ester carboxylesterase
MPYSTETGIKIYYDVTGEGPAMVLIHANPFNHNLWLYQIAHFSSRFRVIALDIRCYGRSEKTDRPFTLEDMAADVIGVCRTEGIERAIIGGVSVGSGIALALALDYPDFVSALILVGGASARPTSYDARITGYETSDLATYQRSHIKDCFAPSFPTTELGRYITDLFVEWAPKLDGKAIGQVFRARGNANLTPRLNAIRTPSLVMNGEHDMSLEDGAVTAAGISGCWHRVLKGAGHCCNIEDPATFDKAVIEFLDHHRLMPPI